MSKKKLQIIKTANAELKENLPADLSYPVSEDIFTVGEKENNVDMENISEGERMNEIIKYGKDNEKDIADNLPGQDLDIPGADLDDQDEAVGSEDEENNYYSIGGDNHNDLDEDFRE